MKSRGAAGQAGPQPPASAWQGSEALPWYRAQLTPLEVTGKYTCLGLCLQRLPQRSPQRETGSWGFCTLYYLENGEGLAEFTRPMYYPAVPEV